MVIFKVAMLNKSLPALALGAAMAATGCDETMPDFRESNLGDGGVRICLSGSAYANANALRSRAEIVAADKDRHSAIPFIVKDVRRDVGEICVDVVNLAARSKIN